jgi:hypothetical protein
VATISNGATWIEQAPAACVDAPRFGLRGRRTNRAVGAPAHDDGINRTCQWVATFGKSPRCGAVDRAYVTDGR